LRLSINVGNAKRFVYILQSMRDPAECYVGVTSDSCTRLAAHNAGHAPYTDGNRPWRALVVIEFDEEEPALKFERYLKTGSGREFARRHFRQTATSPRTLAATNPRTHRMIR
jgi:predicted GIY-YIG superfamily endonuclease